jgi:protein arginine kinase
VKLEELAEQCGEWLRGTGPEADIVMSSRVRLARNLSNYPFVRRCSEQDRAQIEREIRERMMETESWKEALYFNVFQLSPLDRQFLVERQMMSRELADAEGPRAVLIDRREQFSVMINEEDHLRLQVMHSGFDLEPAWNVINQIDDELEGRLSYAFHDRLGYLTACPTNVGTGLRVSVMLHLPALVMTREIEKVFRSLQKMNLAVRGLYGEGSQAMGDFYQISNQITLGQTEFELRKQVSDIVPAIIEYERQARRMLLEQSRKELHDRVSRAQGLLSRAQTISSEETMLLLSSIRLGINVGLITDIDVATINKLFLHTQPAHLQKLKGRVLSTKERNEERAVYLQRHLGAGPQGPLII